METQTRPLFRKWAALRVFGIVLFLGMVALGLAMWGLWELMIAMAGGMRGM